nr:hypothetical protein [Micromonospora sp. DSM 115978]
VVAHVGGQYEEFARVGTLLRRLWLARRRYRDRIVLDGHNQVQLDDTADRTNAEVAAQLDVFAVAGIRAVRRMPAPVRRAPVRLFFPEPPLPEKGMRYVFDILAARDTWMHRLEVAQATEREFVVGDHDHEIVAQVVRDLDREWPGPAVTLALDGPAGGTWQLGPGPSTGTVRADAVEMMLHLSGRAGLGLPPDSPLDNARVVF